MFSDIHRNIRCAHSVMYLPHKYYDIAIISPHLSSHFPCLHDLLQERYGCRSVRDDHLCMVCGTFHCSKACTCYSSNLFKPYLSHISTHKHHYSLVLCVYNRAIQLYSLMVCPMRTRSHIMCSYVKNIHSVSGLAL